MAARRTFAAVLAIAVVLALCGVSQQRIDATRSDGEGGEMLYLPNEKLMTHFTAGLSSVVADIIWLKTIQYTVREFHNPERRFTWLDHLCTTVTRLDPYYADVYAHGGMLLAAVGADEDAMELMRKGAVTNPYAEQIPFEMAKVWLLNRYKTPYAEEMALHYLRMVAERSDENIEFYMHWMRGIQLQKNTPAENARALWEDMLRTATDDIIVELAQNNLMQLTIEENVNTIEEIVAKYETEFGTRPETLEALLSAGMLTALPGDPAQGRYFIDAEGHVQNSMLIERKIVQIRTYLNNEMERYKQAKDRYPYTLHEWSAWAHADIPLHPAAGAEWRYNNERGVVD